MQLQQTTVNFCHKAKTCHINAIIFASLFVQDKLLEGRIQLIII